MQPDSISDGSGEASRRKLWWILTVLLAATVLRIWHLILVKAVVGQPLTLAGWIILAWLLLATIGLVERPTAAGVPRLWQARSREFWIVLAVFSMLLLLFNDGYLRAASDGRGYFAQLHSIAMDHDLEFTNDIEAFGARAEDAYFPPGTALLWLPFYLFADLWLAFLNLLGAEYAREGFANPYQRAVGLGTFVYGFIAVLWIVAALRRFFDRSTSLVATLAILLATPAVWYVAVDASMSHGVSLFVATAFLFAWIRTRGRRTRGEWLLLAVLTIVMVVVRPQNLLFTLVLVVEAAAMMLVPLRVRDWPALMRCARPYILAGGGIAAVGAVVLATGAVSPSYFSGLYLLREWSVGLQLASPHHGLVSSSPIVLFALLGLVPLARKDRELAIAFGVAILAQVLVGGTSSGWNAGASFGARRFVACALPFAIGLAAFVDLARRRPMIPLTLIFLGFVGVNLALVDDVRRGRLTLSEAVPSTRMADAVTSRVGNPFVLPTALLFAWRHNLPLAFYDHMPARMFRRLTIDVGGPDDQLFLIGNWWDPEIGPGGSFRWASSPEVGIFTRVRGDAYTLRFAAEPYTYEDSPPQVLEVRVGSTPIAELTLQSGLTEYEVAIPSELVPADRWFRLSWRFAYAVAPRDVTGSADGRAIAARFEWIDLVPE